MIAAACNLGGNGKNAERTGVVRAPIKGEGEQRLPQSALGRDAKDRLAGGAEEAPEKQRDTARTSVEARLQGPMG